MEPNPISHIQTLPISEVLIQLRSSEAGLDGREVGERLRRYGANEYARPSRGLHLADFARQFTHFLALLLWLAAALALTDRC